VRLQVLTATSMKVTVFLDVAPCSLIEIHKYFRGVYCLHGLGDELIPLKMKAVDISKASVSFYETTRRNIPEDNHLHTRRRENLKSRNTICDFLGV
jgi:hypothetical protein